MHYAIDEVAFHTCRIETKQFFHRFQRIGRWFNVYFIPNISLLIYASGWPNEWNLKKAQTFPPRLFELFFYIDSTKSAKADSCFAITFLIDRHHVREKLCLCFGVNEGLQFRYVCCSQKKRSMEAGALNTDIQHRYDHRPASMLWVTIITDTRNEDIVEDSSPKGRRSLNVGT